MADLKCKYNFRFKYVNVKLNVNVNLKQLSLHFTPEMAISCFPESSGIISNPLENAHYFLFLPDFVISGSLKSFPEWGKEAPKSPQFCLVLVLSSWNFTPLGNGDRSSTEIRVL